MWTLPIAPANGDAMTPDQRAALLAAISAQVSAADRAAIGAWAERILANAGLLHDALDGRIVLVGFDPQAQEPLWDIPGGPPATLAWLFRRWD